MQFRNHRAQMRRYAIVNLQIAAGNCSSYKKRPGLDAVRNHGMFRSVQFFDAANPQRRSAISANLRTHLAQHGNQVGHFRLACRVFQHRLAFRQRRRHQNIFRPRHCNSLKHNVRALQPPPLRTVAMHFCLDVPT